MTERNKSVRAYWAISGFLLIIFFFVIYFRSTFLFSNNPFSVFSSVNQVEDEKYVYGSLGGMLVAIPLTYANFVEYDGDPGFGERLSGDRERRTKRSSIRSFGFEVPLSDISILNSSDSFQNSTSAEQNSELRITITSGEDYPGDNALNNWAKIVVETPNLINPVLNYGKEADQMYGLDVYLPLGVDARTGLAYIEDRDAREVYIQRDEQGNVLMYMQCRTEKVGSPRCSARYSLLPNSESLIEVSFQRTMISDWRLIIEEARTLVYSFNREVSI